MLLLTILRSILNTITINRSNIWAVLYMCCYFTELRTILFFKGISLTYKGKNFFVWTFRLLS